MEVRLDGTLIDILEESFDVHFRITLGEEVEYVIAEISSCTGNWKVVVEKTMRAVLVL